MKNNEPVLHAYLMPGAFFTYAEAPYSNNCYRAQRRVAKGRFRQMARRPSDAQPLGGIYQYYYITLVS